MRIRKQPCYYAEAPKVEYARYSLRYIQRQVKIYRSNPRIPFTLENFEVSIQTMPLRTFFTYGFDCIACGVKGSYFSLEATLDRPSKPSLTLYTTNHVMMTCDHKIARALGGANRLENLQPMCFTCNNFKAQIEGKVASLQREINSNFNLDTLAESS